MADRILTPLERRVLAVLVHADRRWLKAIEIAEDLAHARAPVQSTLSSLRRAGLVTAGHHERFTVTYSATERGAAALAALGEVEVGR